MTRYHAELAWLGGDRLVADVAIEVTGDRIDSVSVGVPRGDATPLEGVTLPAFVDAHSHAFHRVLRGRTHRSGGDFWSWRHLMYRVADRLDPESYETLATAVYAEAATAGIGTVGEFHYLHHSPGGTPYAEVNAMGHALVRAAGRAGIRLVLIDTCYLRADFDRELEGARLRFGDPDAEAWAARVAALDRELVTEEHASLAVAAHSVRTVTPGALSVVASIATRLGVPLHTHLSEQPAENEAALAATGSTPTRLLAESGCLGPGTAVIHATHPSPDDVDTLGAAGVTAVLCPTTEADLGDGPGPAIDLVAAGARLATGSDAHVATDPLGEARRIELHDRLRTRRRGLHPPEALLRAATVGGSAALGRVSTGITTGAPADLVTIGLDAPRLAGADPEDLLPALVFAGSAADVTGLMVAGRWVVDGDGHREVPDVARALDRTIRDVVDGTEP